MFLPHKKNVQKWTTSIDIGSALAFDPSTASARKRCRQRRPCRLVRGSRCSTIHWQVPCKNDPCWPGTLKRALVGESRKGRWKFLMIWQQKRAWWHHFEGQFLWEEISCQLWNPFDFSIFSFLVPENEHGQKMDHEFNEWMRTSENVCWTWGFWSQPC